MTHYLQYHTVRTEGELGDAPTTFSVYWKGEHKRPPIGCRMWLIAGRKGAQGHEYYLAQWFDVESVDLSAREASGSTGEYFGYSLPLNEEPWFVDLRQRFANFSLGLSRLPEEFAARLQDLASGRSRS